MHNMANNPLGADGLIARDSGLWVKDKLHYLQRYLEIFTIGMKNKWGGRLFYVDLFAGPGKCLIRSTQEEIDGSPLLALNFDFSQYLFFEADSECFEALRARVASRAQNKKVKLIFGDCNETISQTEIPTTGLGLAFIDPTGFSPLAFDTIHQLTFNRRIDLIINFHDGMGLRRNFHQYTQGENTALDAFMGSGRWRQRFREGTLSFDQACREIVNEYIDNLRNLGYLAFGRDMVPVTGGQNVLLYYLLFASKDPKGNQFWREIGKIDPHGQRKLGF